MQTRTDTTANWENESTRLRINRRGTNNDAPKCAGDEFDDRMLVQNGIFRYQSG